MPTTAPRLFIGSSKESLAAAQSMAKALRPQIDAIVWPTIFSPSDFTLEALLKEADRADLALLVFTPADEVRIRKQRHEAVRDNVLFEFGLFVGRLGRRAAFYLTPSPIGNLRVSTDLSGLNAFTYDAAHFAATADAAMETAAADVKNHVRRLIAGTRERKTHSGRWTQTWKVAGSRNFRAENTSAATVLHIDRRFRAQFQSGSVIYIADAQVDGQTITGIWRDAAAGGAYHGAFELSVLRNGKHLEGRWIGHREDRRRIAEGSWTWCREE